MEATTGEKLAALGASFKTLMEDIALKISPAFNRQVDALRYFFDVLDRWVKGTSPETLQALATGLEALAGVMVLLTGARLIGALGAFAVGGPGALGVLGLIAAVGALATIDWQAARSALESIYQLVHNWLVRMKLIAPEAAGPKQPPPTAQFLVPGGGGAPWWLGGSYADAFNKWARGTLPLVGNTPGALGWTGAQPVPSGMPGASWLPGALQTRGGEQKNINVHLNLDIDGQTLASTVWQSAIQYNQFPSSGSSANGWSGWPGTDQNILGR
jgi:hypothetical protein